MKMEVAYQPAAYIMYNFLTNAIEKRKLQKLLLDYIPNIRKWELKAYEVLESIKLKRAFMNKIFTREAEIMLEHYTVKGKGNKPAAKKYKAALAKIKNIDEDKINLVCDEYFWKVCYEFYKREMRIWVLL